MNTADQQIKDLADNLRRQGITFSQLDALRMAESMLEGSSKLARRDTAIVQNASVVSHQSPLTQMEQMTQENKRLREQLHIAHARIAELERHNNELNATLNNQLNDQAQLQGCQRQHLHNQYQQQQQNQQQDMMQEDASTFESVERPVEGSVERGVVEVVNQTTQEETSPVAEQLETMNNDESHDESQHQEVVNESSIHETIVQTAGQQTGEQVVEKAQAIRETQVAEDSVQELVTGESEPTLHELYKQEYKQDEREQGPTEQGWKQEQDSNEPKGEQNRLQNGEQPGAFDLSSKTDDDFLGADLQKNKGSPYDFEF